MCHKRPTAEFKRTTNVLLTNCKQLELAMLLRIPSSSGFGVMDAYTAFGIHDSTVVFKS